MPRDILVLVEHSAGKIDSLSSQLLAIGQRLAAEMRVDLVAAAVGHRMENVVERISRAMQPTEFLSSTILHYL